MQKAKIIADSREIFSGIPDWLSLKADVEIKQLPVGDYVLSHKVAVERKRAEDFLDSLVKKRIFEQVKRLKEAYEKPVLIIEDEGLFSRNINSRAVYGAIACLLTDYEIPVIRTRDAEETASLLYAIAAREQFKKKREICLRGEKPSMNLKERQRFIVEGLPNVSAVLAKRLLNHFGSVRKIFNASMEELQEVEGIGKKKAKTIIEVIEAEWKEDEEI
jgi:Fanconi anemia group M protein